MEWLRQMHVFHIKGFQGLLMFALALIAIAVVVFALPAAFMMTLWNATVFEGLQGPEFNFTQGLILWLMTLIVLKLIFNPEIQLQMTNVSDPSDLPPDLDQQFKDWTNKKSDNKK